MNVCMNMFGCGCMCVCRRMDVFKHNMYRGSVQAHVHAKIYNIVDGKHGNMNEIKNYVKFAHYVHC